MASQSPQPSNRGLWRLAGAQHGPVSREQLIGLGFGRNAIAHRVAKGRLHPKYRGVYVVGRPELTRKGEWMAAVLRLGDGAVLSHESAAALWGIRPDRARTIEVSVRRGDSRIVEGILVHRRRFEDGHVTRRHNVPVTSVAVTIIDLASRLPRDEVEAAVNQADILRLTNLDALRAAVAAAPNWPGARVVREMLDPQSFRRTRSWLERRFLPIAGRVPLPQPLTCVQVNGFEVDFYWPDLKLVVEADGLAWHRTPSQQAKDHVRDHAHAVAETERLRFSYDQIEYEPDYVEATLTAVVQRLRRAA